MFACLPAASFFALLSSPPSLFRWISHPLSSPQLSIVFTLLASCCVCCAASGPHSERLGLPFGSRAGLEMERRLDVALGPVGWLNDVFHSGQYQRVPRRRVLGRLPPVDDSPAGVAASPEAPAKAPLCRASRVFYYERRTTTSKTKQRVHNAGARGGVHP
jgi:hypothetical protein